MIEYNKKKFKPINIIYKPVKSPEKKFGVTIYQNRIEIPVETVKNYHMGLPLSIIIVESFFARADKQKRHIENFSGVPGITYNFSNKNLITFEDNFKSF